MSELLTELAGNPAIVAALSAAGMAALITAGDWYVKKTKNKLDDTIWAGVKRVILRRGKK